MMDNLIKKQYDMDTLGEIWGGGSAADGAFWAPNAMTSLSMTPVQLPPNSENHWGNLTKREHYCLTLGVPDTGDDILDDIIRKSIIQKAALAAITPGNIPPENLDLWSGMFADMVANKMKECEK